LKLIEWASKVGVIVEGKLQYGESSKNDLNGKVSPIAIPKIQRIDIHTEDWD